MSRSTHGAGAGPRALLVLLVLAGVVAAGTLLVGSWSSTALPRPGAPASPAAVATSPGLVPTGSAGRSTGRGATASAASPAPPAPSPAPVTVVGLGDSVMSGASCDCDGIVAEYARELQVAGHRPVSGVNLGVPGDTSADLLDLLNADARTRSAVASADVVLVTIGANDLLPQLARWQQGSCDASCYTPAVQRLRARLADVVAAVERLRAGGPVTVLVTDYWNVFTDGDVARATGGERQLLWSQEVTAAANRAICQAATSGSAHCVDLTAAFRVGAAGDPTSLLADDGDHPNAAGVRVIARALVAATPGISSPPAPSPAAPSPPALSPAAPSR